VDAGPLVGRVAVRTTFGPSSATVTYELRAGAPELLVHVDLDWHHDEHLLSMAFPLDVRADTAACDVQFGVVHRPTHPSTPWDAAKYEVCAHRFVDVTEPGFGVAVLNDGRYGHCLFGGAVRVSLARAAKYPDPTADHGRHSVTLALLPHGADRAAVRAAAARLNRPVRVIQVPPVDRAASDAPASTTGLTPPPASVVRLDGPRAAGVEIDAVKLADDGSGDLVVRLHEALGDRAAITVSGPQRIVDAWRCDLLEDPVSGEDVGDGVVVVTLRPFELVTLRLRRGPGTDGRDTRR
jgi:alpha-mannosidase